MARPPRTVDLQLRRVPLALRERLRTRASRGGKSMSKYAVELLAEGIDRPTIDEWLDLVRSDPRVAGGGPSAADIIRGERERRDARWAGRWSSSTPRRR